MYPKQNLCKLTFQAIWCGDNSLQRVYVLQSFGERVFTLIKRVCLCCWSG